MAIVVKVAWHGIVGHRQIQPAIVVYIDKYRGKTVVAFRIRYASFLADVRKSAIAVIVKQMVALAGHAPRSAHHSYSPELTEAGRKPGGRSRQPIGIELHISGDEQVQKTIVVIITPGRSCRPTAKRDARLLRHVGEGSVVIVVIKTVLAVIGDINVWPTIVVVIADGYAEAPALVGHPRFFRDVGKSSVVVVVKKHGARRRLFSFQGGN